MIKYKVGDDMKIGIVADHRGYKLKQKVTKYLKQKKYDVIDYSPLYIPDDDYPDYGILLGEKLKENEIDYGIAICANGVGMSIACNKVKGARCAKINNVWEVRTARHDDDINSISLPINLMLFEIKDIIDTFLDTPFSTIEKYSRRLQKLKDYEERS